MRGIILPLESAEVPEWRGRREERVLIILTMQIHYGVVWTGEGGKDWGGVGLGGSKLVGEIGGPVQLSLVALNKPFKDYG